MEGFEKEMDTIRALDDADFDRLEKFTNMFTRSINLIATALQKNLTLPR